MTAMIDGAVAGAKALLRLEGGGEDALLARLASAATELGEVYCGVGFLQRSREEVLVGTGAWQALHHRPVSAIAGIVPVEAGVVLRVQDHALDLESGLGRVRVPAGMRVTVRYIAGLAADWETLPAPVAHGVVLLAVHLFENRSATQAPPAAVTALWRPYRMMRL